MNDLISKQAAIAALGERPLTWVGGDYELGRQNQFDSDLLAIENVPSVDAVEVVRCKDCEWYGKPGCAIRIVDDSDRPKETDFCSFGERRIYG